MATRSLKHTHAHTHPLSLSLSPFHNIMKTQHNRTSQTPELTITATNAQNRTKGKTPTHSAYMHCESHTQQERGREGSIASVKDNISSEREREKGETRPMRRGDGEGDE